MLVLDLAIRHKENKFVTKS